MRAVEPLAAAGNEGQEALKKVTQGVTEKSPGPQGADFLTRNVQMGSTPTRLRQPVPKAHQRLPGHPHTGSGHRPRLGSPSSPSCTLPPLPA
jgi:hypothetical protein